MAEIFLKKPSRIQALAMVVVLCLFVYAMTSFQLQWELQATGETVTGQTKKQTRNPNDKVDVLPLSESPGIKIPGRRRGNSDCHESDTGIVEDTPLLGREYESYYS